VAHDKKVVNDFHTEVIRGGAGGEDHPDYIGAVWFDAMKMLQVFFFSPEYYPPLV
jgi:hypothetical protein